MNNWFSTKVKYTKHLENGNLKRVTEQYMLTALSFTDAEARIYEEMGAMVQGEFIVSGIAISDINEVFPFDDIGEWYKCKITYELLDDESEKAKALSQNFLVEAESVIQAYDRLMSSLDGLVNDFKVTAIAKSPILDIFKTEVSQNMEVLAEDEDH